MRLALDVTPMLGAPTGVGAFAGGLLTALQSAEVEVSAYALSWRGRSGWAALLPEVVSAARWPMVARALLPLWGRMDAPVIERWTGPVDVVHGTNFVVPPSKRAGRVVTVHDLTAVRYPEMCTKATLRYPALVRRAVAGGALVHTPTAAIAEDVVSLLGVDAGRVHVVHNGFDPADGGDPERGRAAAGAERYVLALGTIEPRKDYASLVRAFADVAASHPDVNLAIAGGSGWGAEAVDAAIAASGVDARVRRLGYVNARQRSDLLAGASVLAYPSVYEGFGLPPLEAMSAGVPVVATDIAAVREVVADAAVLVQPGAVDSLAEALSAVLSDDGRRASLIDAGRERCRRFSWERCAQGMVGVYRQAAA